MTLHPALAPLARGFRWCGAKLAAGWRWLKRKLGFNAPGWPSEPRNEDHATYRRLYEELLPVLRGLPRGDQFEERKSYQYLAELLIGLHNYGDDPILPPGIRRVVVRESQRLATFGAVGQQSLLGRIAGWFTGPLLPYILIVAALFSFTGWGGSIWNGWRADRMESQRDEARADLAQAEREIMATTAERDMLKDAHAQAIVQSQQTAATIEAERARRLRADQELRRIRNAVAQAGTDSPIDYGFGRVRNDEPADGAGRGGAGSEPGHPG